VAFDRRMTGDHELRRKYHLSFELPKISPAEEQKMLELSRQGVVRIASRLGCGPGTDHVNRLGF
jgi:hypothetical protein